MTEEKPLGRCTDEACGAPDAKCRKNKENYVDCDCWQSAISNAIEDSVNKQEVKSSKNSHKLRRGEKLTKEELQNVTIRSSPLVIGLVGKSDAGKTSYLGMLFTLLSEGKKISTYDFSNSFTLLGWEKLAATVRDECNNGSVPMPASTEYSSLDLYHLGLRKNGNLKDIFLADASGEVFRDWAIDKTDTPVTNANWIHKNCDAFIFFIDCKDLAMKRNQARVAIQLLITQFTSDDRRRPVAIVWSRADYIDKMPEPVKINMTQDIALRFNYYKEFAISNLAQSNPDEKVHKNNVQVLEWLLEETAQLRLKRIELNVYQGNDYFLNYRNDL